MTYRFAHCGAESVFGWKKCRAGLAACLATAALSGAQGMEAVPGDYNADRHSDIALYDASAGLWAIRTLSGAPIADSIAWGGPGMTAVPGDYDGDGVWDIALYSEAFGAWYIRTVTGSVLAWNIPWGGPGMSPVPGDYDGDGVWDLAVYNESLGQWNIVTMAGEALAWGLAWGGVGLEAVSGDYDGDGKADLAVYDEASGTWYVQGASGVLLAWGVPWGGAGLSPESGDFDGDGASDLAVRNSASGLGYAYSLQTTNTIAWAQPWGAATATAGATDFDADGKADPFAYVAANGSWTAFLSRSGYAAATFPWQISSAASRASRTTEASAAGRCISLEYAADSVEFAEMGLALVAGDYDGDNIADMAAYQPSNGVWHIYQSRDSTTRDVEFGGPGMEPVAGDYDGDGTSDQAVFLRESAMWFISFSAGGGMAMQWGTTTCTLVPGDYDGDGISDLAVFLPETSEWWVLYSGGGSITGQFWGFSSTLPAQADYDGDGKTDLAVFWPEQARWYVLYSNGGALKGDMLGWQGCLPIPADYDGDGRADLAVYWPAGGSWLIRFGNGLELWNTWLGSNPIDNCSCTAIPVVFGTGDTRLCTFNSASGRLLIEPAAPTFESALGSAAQVSQAAKQIVNMAGNITTAKSGLKAMPVVAELILGVAESVLEDFEQDERDEKIELINTKLDGISSNLTAITLQLDNLMSSINYTRDELKRSIWQASIADAVDKVDGTFGELRQFNRAAYRSMSATDRSNQVAMFLSDYDKRDISGNMTTLHNRLVGKGTTIESAMNLWTTQLVTKVVAGQDLSLCSQMLESYFIEQVSYQVEGLQVLGHVYQYLYGTNSVLFENYVRNTFAPRMSEQTDFFLRCVDQLVVSSLPLQQVEVTSSPVSLPANVASVYKRADFIGQALSTNCPEGIWVRIMGEPDSVLAYAAGNNFKYTGAGLTNVTLALVPVGGSTVRAIGNLKCGQYLVWNWYVDGDLQGYNKFKHSSILALAKGLIQNPTLGQNYAINAPFGNDASGRGVQVIASKYDTAMQPVADSATNTMTFGSTVLYIRNYPAWKTGVSERTGGNLWGADGLFGWYRTINPYIGNLFIETKFQSIQDTCWFLCNPSSSQRASMTLKLYNEEASETTLTFNQQVYIDFDTGGGQLRSHGFPQAYLILALNDGVVWSKVENTYVRKTYDAASFARAVPASTALTLTFRVEQYSEWPGGNSFWNNTWEKIWARINWMTIQ